MSIASEVKQKCLGGKAAISFEAGNAVGYDNERTLFSPGECIEIRRNLNGRCTKAVYEYSDGSKLTYKYNTKTSSFSLTVKEPVKEN